MAGAAATSWQAASTTWQSGPGVGWWGWSSFSLHQGLLSLAGWAVPWEAAREG